MAEALCLIDTPSPNFGERRGGGGVASPDLIVLHYTAMDSAGAAIERLCDPAEDVSAHYLISETGLIHRLVAEDKRAWHAGAGAWGQVTDVNSASIGIELANTGFAPFPEPQMAALERLLKDVMTRHGIPGERVIGHSDMAPARKSDPGRRFDWRRLARQGLSVWPDAGASGCHDRGSMREAAHAFGYSSDVGDDDLLRAFRLRFRPWATGKADHADLALMHDLANRFPVDPAPRTT